MESGTWTQGPLEQSLLVALMSPALLLCRAAPRWTLFNPSSSALQHVPPALCLLNSVRSLLKENIHRGVFPEPPSELGSCWLPCHLCSVFTAAIIVCALTVPALGDLLEELTAPTM